MHTFEIPSVKIVRSYPSCLEELNPWQAEQFVKHYLTFANESIDADEFKIRLAWDLIGFKKSTRYHRMTATFKPSQKQSEEINRIHANIYRLSTTLESFFEEEEKDGKKCMVLRYSCIKQLMPKIGRYYGPQDAMTDSSFWEYKEAHNAFVSFVETKEVEHLYTMAAILYRPKKRFLWLRKMMPKYDGRQRRNFTSQTNPETIARRARKMAKQSMWKLYYVYLYFNAVQRFLVTGRPVIDGKEINLSVLYEGASGGENIGLTGILFSLAETHVFGDIDKTANVGLYDIMARLYQVATMYKKAKPKQDDPDKGI